MGAQRVHALEQAQVASRARLDATQTGHEVGDRTLLDLLNAQNDDAATALALAQARSALLIDHLRLALLAGQLDEARLRAVNQALAPAQ
ncbi:MAG: TolC family protein [Paenacidovorax caeni]